MDENNKLKGVHIRDTPDEDHQIRKNTYKHKKQAKKKKKKWKRYISHHFSTSISKIWFTLYCWSLFYNC